MDTTTETTGAAAGAPADMTVPDVQEVTEEDIKNGVDMRLTPESQAQAEREAVLEQQTAAMRAETEAKAREINAGQLAAQPGQPAAPLLKRSMSKKDKDGYTGTVLYEGTRFYVRDMTEDERESFIAEDNRIESELNALINSPEPRTDASQQSTDLIAERFRLYGGILREHIKGVNGLPVDAEYFSDLWEADLKMLAQSLVTKSQLGQKDLEFLKNS